MRFWKWRTGPFPRVSSAYLRGFQKHLHRQFCETALLIRYEELLMNSLLTSWTNLEGLSRQSARTMMGFSFLICKILPATARTLCIQFPTDLLARLFETNRLGLIVFDDVTLRDCFLLFLLHVHAPRLGSAFLSQK